MTIIIDENTRVIVQGITGREGKFHSKRMIEYGTKIVGGVTPGRGGTEVDGVPVFNTVEEAVKETDADASITFIPPAFAADGVMEAISAGMNIVICVADGIPLHDELRICRTARKNGVILIGPNTPGIISPAKTLIGFMPPQIFSEGNIGMVSRSGSLLYQASYDLTSRNLGQSTVVGIGGDRVTGLNVIDVLKEFNADNQTELVVLIGEIGGREEEMAAEFIKSMSKPVIAYIAGITAPPEKRMGHAGAIVEGGVGTAESKIKALKAANVDVAQTLTEIAEKTKRRLES